MFAPSLFARICSTCKDLNSMNSYYLWFNFLSVVEDMINLKYCVPITMCLNKMPIFLQTHCYVFSHIPKPKLGESIFNKII
jgi:hypothetical protein